MRDGREREGDAIQLAVSGENYRVSKRSRNFCGQDQPLRCHASSLASYELG